MNPSSLVPALAACLFCVLLASPVLAETPPAAPASAVDEEWSVRLLQEKARIERFQERLDHLSARYAKAVLAGETASRLRTLKAARDAAADALDAAERKLPSLLAEARSDGVGEEILHPYRYATSPASPR